MKREYRTPDMTPHKAFAATIAGLLVSIVLSLLGITPTTEEMLAADMQELVVNIAGYVAVIVVPGLAAYFQRNYVK